MTTARVSSGMRLRSQLLFRLARHSILIDLPMKLSSALALLALIAGLITVSGCKPAEKKADAHPSPAKVATIAQEGQLNTIQLTEDAEKRLGITFAPVEKRHVSRVRSYGGEIALPPGASLVISA